MADDKEDLSLYIEEIPGPTPHGGVRATFEYFDNQWIPAIKDLSTRVDIKEYAEDGKIVFRGLYGKSPKQQPILPKKRPKRARRFF